MHNNNIQIINPLRCTRRAHSKTRCCLQRVHRYFVDTRCRSQNKFWISIVWFLSFITKFHWILLHFAALAAQIFQISFFYTVIWIKPREVTLFLILFISFKRNHLGRSHLCTELWYRYIIVCGIWWTWWIRSCGKCYYIELYNRFRDVTKQFNRNV